MRETQEAFERMLRAAEAGETTRPPTGSAEAEASDLVALAEQLHRMQYIRVSPSARQRILVKALNTPFEPRRGRILQFPSLPGLAFPGLALPAQWTRTAARVAASIALVGLLGGTVSVSAASLPDSPLYPVKLLVADVRIAVALPEQKPRLYTEQAAQRLQETEAMIESGNIHAAERSADDAARRLDAARSAVEGTGQPEVRIAIDQTRDRAAIVNKRLEEQGGTPPKPAVASLVSPASRPAALPQTSSQTDPPPATAIEPPAEATAVPEATSGASASPNQTAVVGAPAVGFTPIAGAAASPVVSSGSLAVPTATSLPLLAPAPPAFVPISMGASPTVRPLATAVVGAPVQTFTQIEPPPTVLRSLPTLVPSPTRTATPTATFLPTVAPTHTPSPTRTAVPAGGAPSSPAGRGNVPPVAPPG